MNLKERHFRVTAEAPSLVLDMTAKHFDHPVTFIVGASPGAEVHVDFSNSALAVRDPEHSENVWCPWSGNPIVGAREIVRYAPIKAIRFTVQNGTATIDQKG